VDQLACNLNRRELQSLLSGLARIQPVERRAEFLATLQKLSAGNTAPEEDSDPQDRPAVLVRQIRDITAEAEERRDHIENGEYYELDGWEDDRYGRGGWYDDEEPDALTEESRAVLDFLLMLCSIGRHYPGFETDIHGAKRGDDGVYRVRVLKNDSLLAPR